ncbi:MAG TPA: hypothetical protein VGA20_05690 [Gemmatimonadales bacterium]
MPQLASLLLLLAVMTNFAVLGTSRLITCIQAVAVQGAILSLLPLAMAHDLTAHVIGLTVGTFAIKAVAMPRLLRWAIREVAARRDVEPLIGYMPSLLAGALAFALAFAIAARLPLPGTEQELLVPVALTGVITGLLVLTTRRKAVTQVIGYLMLENGTYVFGLALAGQVPLLVEAGVLLDVFAGVFVMGIVIFHINREFETAERTP